MIRSSQMIRTKACHRVHNLVVLHHHKLPFLGTRARMVIYRVRVVEPYCTGRFRRLQMAKVVRLQYSRDYAMYVPCKGMIWRQRSVTELCLELLARRLGELRTGLGPHENYQCAYIQPKRTLASILGPTSMKRTRPVSGTTSKLPGRKLARRM